MDRRNFIQSCLAAVAGTAIPEAIDQGLETLLDVSLDIESTAEASNLTKKKRVIGQAYQDTLDKKINEPLEDQIEHFVKYLRRKDVIRATEKTSFYVYDAEKKFVVADINIDSQVMAASMIKPFVMLAAYQKMKKTGLLNSRVSRGKRIRRNKLVKTIKKMIQYGPRGSASGNRATNSVLKYLGGPRKAQSYLGELDLFEKTKIVERIPGGGRTYRNMISTHDLNILLNQLYRGNLVSKDISKEMLDILGGYQTSRIKRAVLPLTGVKSLAGKTGFVYGVNGESAIINYENKAGQKRPIIFTALLEDRTKPRSSRRDRNWGKISSEIIRNVAKLTIIHYQGEMVDRYRNRAERVKRIDDWVQAYGQRGSFLKVHRHRGRQYLPLVKKAAREQKIKYQDLYSFLMVESGFRTNKVSRSGAAGIAQIMPGTARGLGLKVRNGRDDRLNPEKAIPAAAKLLKTYQAFFQKHYNYNSYAALENAMAGYNRGPYNTNGGLGNLLKKNKEVSFWHLDRATLGRESYHYVPKVLATRKIIFGF